MEAALLPGPRGMTPGTYEVDKERHTESYITAVRGNSTKIQVIFFRHCLN